MKKRIKIISAERAINIVDALLLHSGEWIDESVLPERVQKLLADLHKVAHTCSRPSCEETHQHWIPEIRDMEKKLIKNGFCTPLNRRSTKVKRRERRQNSRSFLT